MKFNIGDTVWFAENIYQEHRVTCTDCFGDLCLTVVMGDGSKVSIPCAGCGSHTYGQYSRGYNIVHQYAPKAISGKITAIELKEDSVEYQIGMGGGSYRAPKAVFASEQEALIAAAEMAREQTEKAHADFLAKEKPTRTWSWDATYHRGRVRDAERELAYHKAKLSVSKAERKPAPEKQP